MEKTMTIEPITIYEGIALAGLIALALAPTLKRLGAGLVTLALLRMRARRGSYTTAGEMDAVSVVLRALNISTGYAVDIAASDGVTQSCTLELYRDHAWRGLAVEFDPIKFSSLAFVYAQFPGMSLAKCKVTPENVADLLRANSVPQSLDFLNLDIDSYDREVIDALLRAGYRPKVISMEINEKIPPSIYFSVKFDESHSWQGDHFFGCSATAAAATVRPHGYILERIEYNNAIFVESGIAAAVGMVDKAVRDAYNSGYRDRADRTKIFYYNANVDAALAMTPEASLDFFTSHFSKYRGKYELWLVK